MSMLVCPMKAIMVLAFRFSVQWAAVMTQDEDIKVPPQNCSPTPKGMTSLIITVHGQSTMLARWPPTIFNDRDGLFPHLQIGCGVVLGMDSWVVSAEFEGTRVRVITEQEKIPPSSEVFELKLTVMVLPVEWSHNFFLPHTGVPASRESENPLGVTMKESPSHGISKGSHIRRSIWSLDVSKVQVQSNPEL